ncbi:MAG TPA: CheR family methyltransferase, partial [Phototrophicaceae bacterium]|nr:CheR family methyltransferase [Phototrophicaceae bacterium]
MSQQQPLISQIIALIEQRAGLLLHESHREMDAHRAIATTMDELDLPGLQTLHYQLQQHDFQHPVWQTLLQLLTIGETYFFRNQAHFEALRNEILPRMIAHKREHNHRWLRIWSAGCATGEEIYSIAILIRELLPDYKDWSIYLIGTDINEAYLEQATQGVYRVNSFRSETPPKLQSQWFTPQGNSYKLDASIRKMVIFRSVNLVTDTYPTSDSMLQAMDLILCQNVTIYFDRPQTEQIQTALVATLAEDGWLILGHSEPLYIKTPYLGLRNFTNAIVFQRQPAQSSAWSELINTPKTTSIKPATSPLAPLIPKAKTPVDAPGKVYSKKGTKAPVQPQSQSDQPVDRVMEICRQAQAAADQKLWDEALALLDQLANTHPLHEYPHYLRALIYQEKAEHPKAIVTLRQALYCNSNFIMAHYMLGELYNRLGHTTQAKREWQITR